VIFFALVSLEPRPAAQPGLTGWDVELPSEEQKEPQEWPGFARNERIEVERPGAMP